jgi:hypothetical protein
MEPWVKKKQELRNFEKINNDEKKELSFEKINNT